jgi:hypothetical protein
MKHSIWIGVVVALLGLGGAVAHADTMLGITANEPASGLPAQFAGGIFNQPDAPEHAALNDLIFGSLGTPAGAVFGGAFRFDITNMGGFSLDPATDGLTYAWTASFELDLYTGPTEDNTVNDVQYTTTVVGTFNDISSGWNFDAANGIWSNVSLYLLSPTPHGIFRFATDTLPAYWTGTGAGTLNGDFLNGDGQISYNAGFPNSAFILTGSDVSITSTVVPLPAGALMGFIGFAMLGGAGIAKRRKGASKERS